MRELYDKLNISNIGEESRFLRKVVNVVKYSISQLSQKMRESLIIPFSSFRNIPIFCRLVVVKTKNISQ